MQLPYCYSQADYYLVADTYYCYPCLNPPLKNFNLFYHSVRKYSNTMLQLICQKEGFRVY